MFMYISATFGRRTFSKPCKPSYIIAKNSALIKNVYQKPG